MDDKPDPNHVPIGGVPFNERAALEELEHFRREIERYQAVRHGVSHEFEHFVESFKHPEVSPKRMAPPPLPEPFLAPSPIAAPPPAIAPKPPAAAEPFQPSRRIESPRPERVEAVTVAEIAPPQTKRALPPWASTKWLAIGSAVVILSVGGYAWMKRGDDSATPATPSPQHSGAVPTAPPATQPPAAEPAAPPVTKPLPFEAVLTTSGPVWVRLTADGERVFERELAAGQRIPFTARESIVIRAGNPAAVRLTIGGVDQGSLGKEGFPVTRKFDVPR